jgi:uncharacterized protein
MGFFRQWGEFMLQGARMHAQWEIANAKIILGEPQAVDRIGALAAADHYGRNRFCRGDQPGAARYCWAAKKPTARPFIPTGIFIASILIGVCAGLITGPSARAAASSSPRP